MDMAVRITVGFGQTSHPVLRGLSWILKAISVCLLVLSALACSSSSSSSLPDSSPQRSAGLTESQYSWCQSHFTRNDIIEPGATPMDEVYVDQTAVELGLTAPDGGDVVTYWLNTYVGDSADDWGRSPSPHWDAAYKKITKDPLFIQACQAAYAKRGKL